MEGETCIFQDPTLLKALLASKRAKSFLVTAESKGGGGGGGVAFGRETRLKNWPGLQKKNKGMGIGGGTEKPGKKGYSKKKTKEEEKKSATSSLAYKSH